MANTGQPRCPDAAGDEPQPRQTAAHSERLDQEIGHNHDGCSFQKERVPDAGHQDDHQPSLMSYQLPRTQNAAIIWEREFDEHKAGFTLGDPRARCNCVWEVTAGVKLMRAAEDSFQDTAGVAVETHRGDSDRF